MMFYIFQVMLGLITPLLSFLFLPIYKNQRLQVVTIAAFITTIFVFFKPLDGYDLLVHYQNFLAFQSGQYELFSHYIGVDVLIYLITLLGLEKNALVLIASFMLFYATFKFVEFKVSSDKIVITFLIIIASYPLVLLISGVRFSLALSFFLLSDISFSKRNYTRFVILAAFSIMFHYAASVLVIIYVASKFFRVSRVSTKLVACILLMLLPLVFYQTLLIQVVSSLMRVVGFEQYVGLDLSRYVSGEWGAMRSSSYNLNGLLGYFLPKFLLCLLGFVYLFTSKVKDSFIIALFSIILLMFNFGDIGDRYSICLIPFLITSLMVPVINISLRDFPLPLVFVFCYVSVNIFKEFLLYGEVYMYMFQSVFLFSSPLLVLIGGSQ